MKFNFMIAFYLIFIFVPNFEIKQIPKLWLAKTSPGNVKYVMWKLPVHRNCSRQR